jgi:hypothetical protein
MLVLFPGPLEMQKHPNLDLYLTCLPPTVSFNSNPPSAATDPSSPDFLDTMHHLSHIHLPSSCSISNLHTAFANSVIGDINSLSFSSEPTLFYPSWIINLLGELDRLHTKRAVWERSLRWLQLADGGEWDAIIASCRQRLTFLHWDATVLWVTSAMLTTQNLTSLLSADWLDDELINPGCVFIMRLLGPGSRVEILNVYHLNHLT